MTVEDNTFFRFVSAFVDFYDEVERDLGAPPILERRLARYRDLRDEAVKFVGKAD